MTRLEKLQQFLEQDPEDSLTRYMVGLEFASAKNYSEAIRTLEELRLKDAGYVPTYYQLGSFYKEINNKPQAKATLEEGIRRARTASDLHAASELQAALDELDDDNDY
jgi:tetratricopeptide (TPR) repeat protein